MFNKSFFLGIATAVLVLAIVGIGVGAAAQGFYGVGPGGPDRRGEMMAAGEFAPPDRGGFDHDGGHGGHMSFSPLRGLGGIAGNLAVVGALIAVVVLAQGIFSRFIKKQPAPPPTLPPEPIEPVAPDDSNTEPAAAESETAPENHQTEE